MREYPEAATWFGYPGHDHRWTDVSLAAIDRRNRELDNPARVLASIDRARLSAADQVHHDLFERGVDEALEGRRFRAELMPLSQMEGVQQSVAQLLTMMPATSVEGYENIVARLRGVPTLVDQTIALMRAGLLAGLTPPRITLRDVPQQVRNQIVDDPMASPMLSALQRFPEAVGASDRDRLGKAAVEAFADGVAPAYRRLLGFLESEYIPRTRETIAASDLPDGAAYYAYKVRQSTTTDLTPRRIHDIGLA